MTEPCDLLACELALDRLDAELAAELPAHMRAFAAAYARGTRPPPAPAAVLRPTTIAVARAALMHPVLADRGLALLRLALPVAIESDAGVAAARAEVPTWDALVALTDARDAAAARLWSGRALGTTHAPSLPRASTALDVQGTPSGPCVRAIDVLHRLYGSDVLAVAMPGADGMDGAGRADRADPSDAPEVGGRATALRRCDRGGGDKLRADERSGPLGAVAAHDAPPSRSIAAVAISADAGARADRARGDAAGKANPAGRAPMPPPVAGWLEPDGLVLDDDAIARAWATIAMRHGAGGQGVVRFERAAQARPRTFVIVPGREVIVVLPAELATPAARFAVLHELGHALAALISPDGIPRALDEAAGAYVARAVEQPDHPWYSAAAPAARGRRGALARLLDDIERRLPRAPQGAIARPPWALWHDPSAQAAYVAAESLADDLGRILGPAPPQGALAEALADLRDAMDRRCEML